MTNIDPSIMDKIRLPFAEHDCTIDVTFNGSSGTVTVTFDVPIVLTYIYTGHTVTEFIKTVISIINTAIIYHQKLVSVRQDFINLVTTAGSIYDSFLSYCTYLFNGQFNITSSSYDGTNGVLTLSFPDKTYHINFTYIGVSINMFQERLFEACALAIKDRNRATTVSFSDYISGTHPTSTDEVTLTLSSKSGWNSIDTDDLYLP